MRVRNTCSIFLRLEGRKIKLPVNPEELEILYPTDNKTYDVLGVGEIVVPRKPSLKVVSWEGFFPQDLHASYVNPGAKAPRFYVTCFQRAMKEKQICRLIITRSGSFDTNMRCIVSSFETKDKGGEPGDIYYSLELQEYRSYAPEMITIVEPASSAPVAVIGEAGSGSGSVTASAEVSRPVETPVMRVGAEVIVNGIYCNDSYGAKPHGTANNIRTTVGRIVAGNPYPILVGNHGWVQESQLQIVG